MIEPDYSEYISKIEKESIALEESYSIQKQITAPSQQFIEERLYKVNSIANITPVTEENDPNGKLGKPGGYTSQIFFSSPLLGTETIGGDKLIDIGTDGGRSIEVYTTIEDAVTRNNYLGSFDGSIFDSGLHRIVGTMIVRVSAELPASKQEAFYNEIVTELIKP